jgi:pimeloyl-ACP methyl ester carboxylesterase
MAVKTEAPADIAGVRSFTIDVPDADLVELRSRIAATRWPDKETTSDQSQGVPLATIQELARYWEREYDWRKVEARLNALPQFLAEIDGLDIHVYTENGQRSYFAAKGVSIPAAVSAFPDELYQAPRSWSEQAYPNLIYYNKLDKGGHFAAWEQPEVFSDELRAAFRSLR